MAERAPSAKKTIVKSKRTLRKRGECVAAFGLATSGECPKKRRCWEHSRRTESASARRRETLRLSQNELFRQARAVAPNAPRATFADTAKHIRNTEQTRKICRADFFSQRNAVKKISPGARRFCLFTSNRFIRGAKPRPGGRGLMLIRERGYLCRLAVI